MKEKIGKLFVVTGPSGVGKGTILEHFFKNNKEGVTYSVSMTTRAPRPNEKEGVNYFFVDETTFKAAVDSGKMLEWTYYSGHYYGTGEKFVNEKLQQGINVILEIETQGASSVMEKYPSCVSIFIIPPSYEELEHRLRNRKTEDEDSIKKRLEAVVNELSFKEKYKYIIINDELNEALNKLQAIYDYETKAN